MDHIPEMPQHDTGPMLLKGLLISLFCLITTEAMTAQVVHLITVLIGAVLVFLAQKLMHFLWDKYVLKK